MKNALREHWPEYLMEAAGLGLFMVSACVFGTLLGHPGSALRQAIADPFLRQLLMGLAMGATLLAIVYSPWGKQSGTSFAAPIVAATVAAMLEANPRLTPQHVRELLAKSARKVRGAPPERQGAGALDSGHAVALALGDEHRSREDRSPRVEADRVVLRRHDHDARQVALYASFAGWREPGLPAQRLEDGLWQAETPLPEPGRHEYKFRIDDRLWLTDPANPSRCHDGYGGLNSVLSIDPAGCALLLHLARSLG